MTVTFICIRTPLCAAVCGRNGEYVLIIFRMGEVHMTQETVTIENKTGIHARPASVFVQTATKFKSKIQLEAKGKKVDAKSILMLMSMGLVKGTELTIIAEGEDEAAAVAELAGLIKSKFGEE